MDWRQSLSVKSTHIPHISLFIGQTVKRVKEIANASINARGAFHCVFAGGHTPRPIYRELRNLETDWSVWHCWFSDERCLSANDPGLNSTMTDYELFQHVRIPCGQIYRIPCELGPTKAASVYREIIRQAPLFDLVLLGLGEDGHTASLFPGHEIGVANNAPDVLAVFHAPKPPSERVSLSAQRLNCSRTVLFLVAGRHKRMIVDAVQSEAVLPASMIRGQEETELLFCTADA
jgi:6-phosphogluconolactonase